MARTTTLAALVALGAALGGCTGSSAGGVASVSNRSLDSVNQPVVQRTDYVFDVASQGDGLSVGEASRLSQWFDSLGIGYGDRVFVEESYGPSRSREDVARIAADYGLLLNDGAPVTAGAVPPGAVRVIVSRSSASVPSCPQWGGRNGPGSTSSNYGCATNSNLAAMIADPSDLVLGQAGSSSGDAATGSKAIKVYRDAQPTGAKGLPTTSTTQGDN